MRKSTFPILVALLLMVFSHQTSLAQELRCNVQVVHSQVQGTNKQVFQTLQKAIYEFMNNQAWTNHVYGNEECIECNMMINIQEQAGDEFSGSIQIQSRRPVFNSSYNTPVFTYKDDNLRFQYVEFEPLEFTLNEHKSNLTSVLAYYAYIILGFDYDSLSSMGGSSYFQNAETIVTNAQNAPQKGWKAFESRKNRYWLVQNILSNEYEEIRQFMYQYHRLGLDQMSEDPAKGRAQITQSLELLQKVYRKKPDPFLFFLQMITEAKHDEFINVYSEANPAEINRAYEILTEIDPANIDKYKRMKQSE
jgi:hypothetical protein